VLNVLFVVIDKTSLTAQEALKKDLLSITWGHTVQLISQTGSQAEFDSLSNSTDVVFIGSEVLYSALGEKLTYNVHGIVNEATLVTQYLKIGTNMWFTHNQTAAPISNNGHYITRRLPAGSVTLFNTLHTIRTFAGTTATGYTTLTTTAGKPGLATLTTSSMLYNSVPCPGRRVHLPWGFTYAPLFNISDLTNDGLNLFRRSLEWASGAD